MEIKFTLQHIQELLAELGKLPHDMVAGIVKGIHSIAQPQVDAHIEANKPAEEAPQEPTEPTV